MRMASDSMVFNSTKFESPHVGLESLKDDLIRFKLLGPLSTTILANVLNVFGLEEMSQLE